MASDQEIYKFFMSTGAASSIATLLAAPIMQLEAYTELLKRDGSDGNADLLESLEELCLATADARKKGVEAVELWNVVLAFRYDVRLISPHRNLLMQGRLFTADKVPNRAVLFNDCIGWSSKEGDANLVDLAGGRLTRPKTPDDLEIQLQADGETVVFIAEDVEASRLWRALIAHAILSANKLKQDAKQQNTDDTDWVSNLVSFNSPGELMVFITTVLAAFGTAVYAGFSVAGSI